MSCRRYEPSDTCGEIVEATCVRVETTFPAVSSLVDESCANAKEVIDDIYSILQAADISEYDKGCLDVATITLLNILQAQTDKICELEDRVAFLEDPCNILDMNITECGLDVSCLEAQDPCTPATPITTIKELFAKLIEKSCA